jgi:hypothetical protein
MQGGTATIWGSECFARNHSRLLGISEEEAPRIDVVRGRTFGPSRSYELSCSEPN